MKKKKLFIIILLFIFLFGCSKKEVELNETLNIFSKYNFSSVDQTSLIDDYNVRHLYALNNGKYQVDYYVFKDDSNAKKAYYNNKNELLNISKEKYHEKSKDNYNKFIQEKTDTYNLLVRTGKSFIYVSCNIEYKKEINKIIRSLGY